LDSRKRKEERRKLYNEDMHCLYRPPNTVSVIKSRRLIRPGQATYLKDHLEDLSVDGRKILKWILHK
jgi:hypothetical protein